MPDCNDNPQNLENKIEGIILTEKAAKKALDIAKEQGLEGLPLRIGVKGGGCSGFQYSMDFNEKKLEIDKVFEFYGLTVRIDPMSYQYLKGTEIDYIDGLYGSGFKFSNPKVKSTCGCGASFSVE